MNDGYDDGASVQAQAEINGGDVTAEEQKLLSILPEELWHEIFDKINDPSDLENIYNTCTLFRRLLLPKRVVFLFPKVLKILDVKYHQSEPSDVTFPEEQWAVRFHEVDGVSYQKCRDCDKWNVEWWTQSVLTLRLVCRMWNQSVDDLLQAEAQLASIECSDEDEFYEGVNQICRSHGFALTFNDHNLPDITKFTEHFNGTHASQGTVAQRSPFLSRKVTIHLNVSVDPLQILRQSLPKEFRRLLDNYGHHVYHCSIVVGLGGVTKCYKELREAVMLMPNLKTFDFCYRIIPFTFPTAQDLQDLEAEIHLNPFPTLHGLKLLSSKSLPVLFNEIIRTNGHANGLEVCTGYRQFITGYQIQSNLLQNLVQMHMTPRSQVDLQNLAASPGTTWNIRKLTLNFGYGGFNHWNHVFSFLEQNFHLLTSLTFLDAQKSRGLLMRQNIVGAWAGTWNMPCLTFLKIDVHELYTVEFIYPLRKTLEYLDISSTYKITKEFTIGLVKEFEVRRNSNIKLLSFSDQLLESNIWTLFEKLKCVRVTQVFEPEDDPQREKHSMISTRREWERKLRKQ